MNFNVEIIEPIKQKSIQFMTPNWMNYINLNYNAIDYKQYDESMLNNYVWVHI